MFPGQGSQSKGMGKELFAEFKKETELASSILGYDLEELCLLDKHGQLNNTVYTQPALYVVNALSYLKYRAEGKGADYYLGHSLGEFSALFASGAYSFETGLRIVSQRAAIMASATNGGMAAIVGLGLHQISTIIREQGFADMDIANSNSPEQIVIAGPRQSILNAQSVFERAGAKLYFPLNVSGAFHSRYMQPMRQQFRAVLDEYETVPPTRTVISNVTAQPFQSNTWKDVLADQICNMVNWNDSMQYLIGQAVENFAELGPGNVLTKIASYFSVRSGRSVSTAGDTSAAAFKTVTTQTATAQRNGNGSLGSYARGQDITKMPQTKERTIPGIVSPLPDLSRNSVSVEPRIAVNGQLELYQAFEGRGVGVSVSSLGSAAFKKDYVVDLPYYAGGMYRGISSVALVTAMAQKNILSFYGSGGLSQDRIITDVKLLRKALVGKSFGVNFLHYPYDPARELELIKVLMREGITLIEASAFIGITEALVLFRLSAVYKSDNGRVKSANRIIAKVSRPETARLFCSPAPISLVNRLLASGLLTVEQARLSNAIAMADDICIECDSAGHTDQGQQQILFPTIARQRDEAVKQIPGCSVRLGLAGGIGTPEAAATAFLLGADFIATGSVNQCTVEAAISDQAKTMLGSAGVNDTAYVPAGDMFEVGAKVQVLKKGVFFPARANKLYDLYKLYDSLNDIPVRELEQIEGKYFKKSLETVFEDLKQKRSAEEIQKAMTSGKYKMAMIFKEYFKQSTAFAVKGDPQNLVDYQIHCGPALGAFNAWVAGSPLADWRNRHADDIASLLTMGAANYINKQTLHLQGR